MLRKRYRDLVEMLAILENKEKLELRYVLMCVYVCSYIRVYMYVHTYVCYVYVCMYMLNRYISSCIDVL